MLKKVHRKTLFVRPLLLVLFSGFSIAFAAETPSTTQELKRLTVEDLMEIEVMSISKRSERLLDAPGSLYVITSEDIRRSSATTLPEILRLAPNLHVAQSDPVQYGISARGFNNAVGNKLLVLIDGRTVYTPLFSGVFWEQQDLMLEDIERIEVISGPGATLWGANAVNGVINVITKSSSETLNGLFVGALGNQERGGSIRYGRRIGSEGSYRVYGKIQDWDNFENAQGVEQPNDWRRGQVGFRFDWKQRTDTFTVQGDAYSGESEHRGFVQNLEITELSISGANLLGRWTRQLSESSEIQLQTYYDHSKRDDVVLFRPTANIFDIEVQHRFHPGKHHIVSGAGYRHASDEVATGFLFTFIPSSRKLDWANFFVQMRSL
jgi:iron complex outermembrane recepter protein